MKDPFVWRFVFSYWWLRRKLQTGSAVPQGSRSIWAMRRRWRGSPGPAGLSLALGSPCPLPELRGGSVSAHPLPSSLLWHTRSWSDVQCRCRDDCPELLMEWDETQELKQWMAQWATDSAFSCCRKLCSLLLLTLSVQLCRECYF